MENKAETNINGLTFGGQAIPLAGFSSIHGIVHADFRDFRRYVASKKSLRKLIGNRIVLPSYFGVITTSKGMYIFWK